MNVPLFHVDAFTHWPFGGNPAAVCLLPDGRLDCWMQPVAAEMNLAETAFVQRQADGLPGIDGYKLVQHLRQQPGLDSVLLVALTGYGQEEDRRLALLAGFDEHLTKPVRFDTLQRLLAERAGAAKG